MSAAGRGLPLCASATRLALLDSANNKATRSKPLPAVRDTADAVTLRYTLHARATPALDNAPRRVDACGIHRRSAQLYWREARVRGLLVFLARCRREQRRIINSPRPGALLGMEPAIRFARACFLR